MRDDAATSSLWLILPVVDRVLFQEAIESASANAQSSSCPGFVAFVPTVCLGDVGLV